MTSGQPDYSAPAEAAHLIVETHYREHRQMADYAMARAVHCNAVPAPADLPEPMSIVEETARATITAEAVYHSQQAERWAAAIRELDIIRWRRKAQAEEADQ